MKSFQKYIKSGLGASFALTLTVGAMSSCSDSYMSDLNTDDSKAMSIDPNAQLTTSLLQTYGDFSLMDTYRSYITGFTQHFAGGWNVTNYAGSVHAFDDQTRLIWDRYYTVSIKNMEDAISKTSEKPNINALLRIHKVYLMSVLTDTYGDVPCFNVGQGYMKGENNPAYDKQEDIYQWFFDELSLCESQLNAVGDRITGDVTSMNGDVAKWKKYCNSLRMRFAMRISDVKPELAREQFEKALASENGYIAEASDDAYIKYLDQPFTLYKGAEKYDFRANALSEILYGQDPTSPTFVSSTFYNIMKDSNDPRLYRICRHYINTTRSEIRADEAGNFNLTDEVVQYLKDNGLSESPCDPGAAWYNNWINAPATKNIPTLQLLVDQNPAAGYDKNNFPARMMRLFLSIDFEKGQNPGILFTSAEAEFLLAEAKIKGWNVEGSADEHYEAGVRASMKLLNTHYLKEKDLINDAEIAAFIAANQLGENPKETINTQAWILHMTNPAEAWSNLRRSDYPVLMDRTKLPTFPDFTYDDPDRSTPTRLKYPILEARYNSENYKEALERLGGTDDWHQRNWWDTADINVK